MIKDETIIEAISAINFWSKRQDTGKIRVRYLERVEKLATARESIVAIIGVRRAGKTTIAKQFLSKKIGDGLKPEQTLYVNLEEPKLEPFLSLELLDALYHAYRGIVCKNDHAYIVLDEIQNVPGWERFARMLQEKKENVKVLVSGSSAKLLSSELATLLTGRTLTLAVHPLSFEEFLFFNGVHVQTALDQIKNKDAIVRLLRSYVRYGGFPHVVLEDEDLKDALLKELFVGIVQRDVCERHKLKDAHLVRTAAELALSNFSSLLSANKLRNMMVSLFKKKISPNAIVKILSYLEEAFLLFQVPIYSHKVKEQKLYPKKIYCIDTGLIGAVAQRPTKDRGKLHENIVAVELRKKFENVYYWRDSHKREVDFIVREGSAFTLAVQVCYDIESEETRQREVDALLKAMDEFRLKKGLIITEDYAGEERHGGRTIRFVPLWKWLLGG